MVSLCDMLVLSYFPFSEQISSCIWKQATQAELKGKSSFCLEGE